MLQDTYGRQFHYLRLSVTDVCNFKCSYCLPDGYACETPRDFLNLAEIRRLVRAFADNGTSKIRITGGEPALRKDLPAIIDACAATPNIQKVALTTNGYNLERQISAWIDAGLNALNVSIDSLKPEVFQRITGFDRLQSIFNGLEKAAELGLQQIKVNAVLMRCFNGQELNHFLSWIKDKPYTLRFIELMQTGDNKTFYQQNHISGESIKTRLLAQGWLPILRSKNSGPAEEFYHPDYLGKIGLIMPYSTDFCASCNRLRVSALGKLHLCLFGEQGYELRDLLQHDNQQAELAQRLQACLGDKKDRHFLDQGNTGMTRHLAMIGG